MARRKKEELEELEEEQEEIDERGINIHICKNIYVKSNSMQFILYEKVIIKKGDNAGTERIENLGYFSTFTGMLMFTYDHLIKTSGAQSIQELKEMLAEIHDEINENLNFTYSEPKPILTKIKNQLNKRTDI